RFNEPATEEQIEKLEKTHNIKLPEEYKEFLRFANGATIMGTSATIYGTDMFGVRDMMVPVDYFTVGERIGDGERIALNLEDGKLY
ncbi:MAG: SMI1/KNR4 family protein, partial [Oscillospiraceae bacterium]|nr:SMI1/KNR4 family protein [Oscillospiraceae bacterium]